MQNNYEELKHFLGDIQEEITNNAIPRPGAVEAIKKLREEGHEIYIITARDNEFHEDPYMLSKNWLDNNSIEYDKLIVNVREKAPLCKNEKIDIFIDDQLNNCLEVSKEGIKTIRFTTDTTGYENMVNQCIKYDTDESWTYGLPREYLKKHAEDWYNCNKMLKEECPKYGIRYIDTSKDRVETLNKILNNIKGEN